MKRLSMACLVLVLCLSSFVAGRVQADNPKQQTVPNAEEHLAKDDEYQKGDLGKKFERLKKLQDERVLDFAQKQWMQVRALLAEARAKKIEKDLPALCQWLASLKKDTNGPVYKNGYSAIDELIDLYGTQRLYKDDAFAKGDLPAKMKRVKELWEARELGQSTTYSLTNDLVYQYLAPAGGDVDKAIALMGELWRKSVMVWDSSASIHRALLVRGLQEKKDLDSVEKKLLWINKVTKDKEGDLAWMMVGNARVALMMDAIDGDAEFQKLDAAGRKAKIEEWAKDGKLAYSDKSAFLAAYANVR